MGLTVNRQKRNIFTVNRQMSEPKLAVQFSLISLNDLDRLTLMRSSCAVNY